MFVCTLVCQWFVRFWAWSEENAISKGVLSYSLSYIYGILPLPLRKDMLHMVLFNLGLANFPWQLKSNSYKLAFIKSFSKCKLLIMCPILYTAAVHFRCKLLEYKKNIVTVSHCRLVKRERDLPPRDVKPFIQYSHLHIRGLTQRRNYGDIEGKCSSQHITSIHSTITQQKDITKMIIQTQWLHSTWPQLHTKS